MAEEEKHGEAAYIRISCVENGYRIECQYESPEKSLGVRAGWYPEGPAQTKEFVEKTKDAVLKRLKEIL